MWSTAVLLLLVGATFAAPQNAWKDGKEYTYKVKSRTLAALNPESKQYTGILMEARLTVQSNGPETLRAKISQPRYSQIHTRLENGWDAEIPENLLNMQSFPLSGKPFEIKTKNGVVRDLIVDKDVPTWEVNVLKSIISQLQVDTQGENAKKKTKHNQLPEGKQPTAMYKVMEDSVGGKCEVLYDVSPMPELAVHNMPELVPMPELREDGDLISLVKTKNYSNCEQRVSYHVGLNGRNKWEPGSNENGKYLSRSSISRVIISGSPKKYTIQSSQTSNKVVLNPDQQDNQQGMVASKMSLTLHEVKDISEQVSPPSDPQSTGNLVYNYNSPFESVSSRRKNQLGAKRRSDDRDTYDSEERKWNRKSSSEEDDSSSDSSTYDNDENNYLQPKPKLDEPPQNPMLPYFIGNNGNSIRQSDKIDALQSVKRISQEIGNELEKPDRMPEDQTLEKFTILSRLIRMMNVEEIANVQSELYEPAQNLNELKSASETQKVRRNAWIAFRDAVAQAGTGPALVNIKQWVQNKKIKGREAANVIDTISKSTRTPTPEYMDEFFEMVKSSETKQQPEVRDTALVAFSELIRHSIVNKQSAHNRYPVHAFGKFSHKNIAKMHGKFFPYMAGELKSSIEQGDSKKIQALITAIGRTAHPRMLSVFEPYIEGKKPVSPYQRLLMVMNLNKLATSFPKVARRVLYKIYSNSADHHEIRTAAVYLLMQTNPPANMLQRMADHTNYDSSKHVSSAVKSSIESLAQLQGSTELSNAARAALPLLTPEVYGPQYSRAVFKNFKDPRTHTGVMVEANYIGSDDSIIPKGVSLTLTPSLNGLKVTKIQMGGSVSTIQNLWNFMQKKLNNDNSMSDMKSQQQKYSPENLSRMLGIHADDPEQIEGFAFLNDMNGNHFWNFDNHSFEKLPEQIRQWDDEMKRGMNFDETKLNNYEVTMSFPTETGYPLTFSLKTPTIFKVKGQTRSNSEMDSSKKSAIPKSATVSGKMEMLYSMKVQKRLGFVAPFEHQEYMTGVDRDIQIHLPLRSEVEYNLNKQEARFKLQPDEEKSEFKVLQYKSSPFTSKHDILSLKPVSTDKNTHVVHKDRASSSQFNLNDSNNKQRLQFVWEQQSSRPRQESESNEGKYFDALQAAEKMSRSISAFYYPNDPEKTEYEKYTVKLSPNNDMSVEMKVSCDTLTEEGNSSEDFESYSPNGKAPRLEKNTSEGERKQKLLREALKNINSAKARAVDISLKLNGDIESSLTITGAVGNSNVDQKSRALLFADAKGPYGKEYFLSAGFEGKNPHAKTMDYEETLKANKDHEFRGEVHFGDRNSEKDLEKLKIQGKMRQTDERKNQVRQSRDALECLRQMNQHGNKLSPACQKANERAVSLDNGDFEITFENDTPLKHAAMNGLDIIPTHIHDMIGSQRNHQEKGEQDKVKVTYELSPDDDSIDVVVSTSEGNLRIKGVKPAGQLHGGLNSAVNEDGQSPRQMMSDANTCYLDKTEAKTFDNHRYNLKLGKCWHVAMTAFPKSDADRPSQQQEVPEYMHVSVLTRENENGEKELKITLGDKEVELSGTSGPREVDVKVDGEKIKISKKKSYQMNKNGEMVLEIFELPDKSVKVVSERYNVKVVFDGSRAMIKAGDRYRDSVRGLCGNNDGEPQNDQQTPKGCLIQKPEEFSATYALINDDKCQGPALNNAEKAKNAECIFETARPGDVISDREAGRQTQRSSSEDDDSSDENRRCMRHRTMVIRGDSEICFSLRPLPKCSSSCRTEGTKNKRIEFHCVARSSVSEKVADRVEKGANPDLSQKSVSKTETYSIPISCRA